MRKGIPIMNRHSTCAVLVMAGCLLAPVSQAASFDCDAARTDVERAICADDQLGREDDLLAEAYGAVRKEMPVTGRAGLLREQRAWLRQRDACVSPDGGSDAAGCLRDAMQSRRRALDAQITGIRDAFDRTVLSIPADPAGAVRRLQDYDSGLAEAWLLYLGRHEPTSGLTRARMQDLRRRSRDGLRTGDRFSSSILDDIYVEDEAVGDMTLLRMWIERAYGDHRAYVHCFVFHRQPALAYRAMDALYGSTRDGSAPICEPEGDLFDSPEWKRLQAAFDPVIAQTHGMDSGTIRFADFAQWRTSDLRLTLTPLDYLDPDLHRDYRLDPVQLIEDWEDDPENGHAWSRAAREEALDALAQARRATVEWLQAARQLSPGQAADVAEAFLQIWVVARVSTAGDGPS